MSSHAKAFMQKVSQTDEGRELTDRVLLSLRLGRLVYKMRTRAGLSQEALASYIGSTQSAISRLESGNGGHVPGNELLEDIARHCGFRMTLSAEPIEGPGMQETYSDRAISVALDQGQGMEEV